MFGIIEVRKVHSFLIKKNYFRAATIRSEVTEIMDVYGIIIWGPDPLVDDNMWAEFMGLNTWAYVFRLQTNPNFRGILFLF